MRNRNHIRRSIDAVFLIVGTAIAVAASLMYLFYQYSLLVLFLWLAGLVIVGNYFFLQRSNQEPPTIFNKTDLYIILALLSIFAPVYLACIYTVPFQINTDEITIMLVEKQSVTQANPDVFALSSYFRLPAFIFIIFGWLGKLIGGINLVNMRIIHALSGLAIIVLTYLFFRSFAQPLYAVAGAVLVGSNHALLAISRMAIMNNTALLFEVIAFALLLRGVKRHNVFLSFLGGVGAGLGFYGYEPGRSTIILWLLFLVLLGTFFKSKIGMRNVARVGVVSLLGFVLVVGPIGVDTFKQSMAGSLSYQRQQLLIFPEGRALQQRWVAGSTISQAVKTNIKRGLTTFNNTVHDQGYIYPNRGHGFVDPLTGILIWLGAGIILYRIIFRSVRREEDFLALGSFLILWLIFSFLLTKAPTYTRLLVILPFVVYLSLTGIMTASDALAELLKRLSVQFALNLNKAIFALFVIVLAVWNVTIFHDFVQKGETNGNDVGGTARYVEARQDIPNYSFYLAASKAYPYYSWGEAWQWDHWLGFFASDQQHVEILKPDLLSSAESTQNNIVGPPFTLFLSRRLYLSAETVLSKLYPDAILHSIKPDGSLIAIEVY